MFADLILLAQEAAPQQQPFWFTMLLPMLLLIPLFLMMRGQRRVERERQTMAASLEKNDKVLTSAGIYGNVISVSPTEDEVVVKVDDSTRLRMTKASILRNITKEEAAKAQSPAKS